jgi:hypothetical protein
MAYRFEIIGEERLSLMLEFLDRKTFRGALWNGLKVGGRGARTLAAKEVGGRYNLKASRIKADISDPILRLDQEAIEFRIKRKPISSGSYGWRDTGRGLRGSNFRGGGRRPLQRGFQMRSERGTDRPGWMRSSNARYPINMVFGPSIGHILLGPGSTFGEEIIGNVLDRTQEQFVKGVESYLKRKAGK